MIDMVLVSEEEAATLMGFKYTSIQAKSTALEGLVSISVDVAVGENPYFPFLALEKAHDILTTDFPEIEVNGFGYVRISDIIEHGRYLAFMGGRSDIPETEYPILIKTPAKEVESLYMTAYTAKEIQTLKEFVES